MADFQWKITDMTAQKGVVKSVSYRVKCSEDDYVVESEGHWEFPDAENKIPFEQLTEQIVSNWVKKESNIEQRLLEQLKYLKDKSVTVAPWLPQTFTIKE